jgi:hypothetical protein
MLNRDLGKYFVIPLCFLATALVTFLFSYTMRERDLLALEFDKVLHLLVGCSLSSAGREACLSLSPLIDPDAVEAASERTWQFFRLLEEQLTMPLREFPDIRPALEWANHVGAASATAAFISSMSALSRALATLFAARPVTTIGCVICQSVFFVS